MQRTFQIIVPLILSSLFLLATCSEKKPADKSLPEAVTETVVAKCDKSVHPFWIKFRDAVLKNDLNAIADMTEFPVVIHRLDGYEKLLSRPEFIKQFPQLLTAPLGKIYDPITPVPASMREWVRAVATLSGNECNGLVKQLDVGRWMFGLRPEGWRLGVVSVPEFPASMKHIPLEP